MRRLHGTSALVAVYLATLTGYAHAQPVSPEQSLITVSENSGFSKTGRYKEVEALCRAFEESYKDTVRCLEFGVTPEGRKMMAIVATKTGALTPEQAREQNVPVVLVQGGIHAGEIEGKDAGFLALREVLEGTAAPNALDSQVLLFVPVFNVDGHERFAPNNRPNQRGPEEMGWRTTAQNYNLNRDYLKVDSPEMRAMLNLYNAWDPLISMDLHATNGAQFEVDISVQVEPVYGGDEGLRKSGLEFRENVMADLKQQGHDPKHYYISFDKSDEPLSGFVHEMYAPRFSTGYFPLRNRINMLVETHSWREYPERVAMTRNSIISTLDQVTKNGKRWLEEAKAADARSSEIGGKDVTLSYKTAEDVTDIEFAGYEYTVALSEVSGAPYITYHEDKPQTWTVPLRDKIVPDLVASAPLGGYVVSKAFADIIVPRLDAHGIEYSVVTPKDSDLELELFRASSATPSSRSVEGRQTMQVEGEWQKEAVELPPEVIFIPISQAKSQLVVAMFEPKAPDSLLSWGFFNNNFESKEYMEGYVAEQVAREMLAEDEALEKEFVAKLKSDPEFASSSRERLRFFYKKHPSWDDRLNLYPVMRVDTTL